MCKFCLKFYLIGFIFFICYIYDQSRLSGIELLSDKTSHASPWMKTNHPERNQMPFWNRKGSQRVITPCDLILLYSIFNYFAPWLNATKIQSKSKCVIPLCGQLRVVTGGYISFARIASSIACVTPGLCQQRDTKGLAIFRWPMLRGWWCFCFHFIDHYEVFKWIWIHQNPSNINHPNDADIFVPRCCSPDVALHMISREMYPEQVGTILFTTVPCSWISLLSSRKQVYPRAMSKLDALRSARLSQTCFGVPLCVIQIYLSFPVPQLSWRSSDCAGVLRI